MFAHIYMQIYFRTLKINQPREYRFVGEFLSIMYQAMWSNINTNKNKLKEIEQKMSSLRWALWGIPVSQALVHSGRRNTSSKIA